jgi:hypothetical protein
MSSLNQDALSRLRQKASRPVTVPPTAGQRQAQRLEQLVRHVVKRPPPGRAIDHLYEELRALAAVSPTAEGEARYQERLKRLRALEAEDARRLRYQLAASGPLKLGEVDAALREARETLARYEHAAPTDPSAKRTDK